MTYLLTTFRCLSDILITSCWLFTTRRSTWPGNHLGPRMAELRFMPIGVFLNQSASFYPSGLSLFLSVDHFFLLLVPLNDVILFHSMVCDGELSQLCLVRIYWILKRTNWLKLFNTVLITQIMHVWSFVCLSPTRTCRAMVIMAQQRNSAGSRERPSAAAPSGPRVSQICHP